ncbi:hypothetical protein TNCV_2558231 [Trichonephila clavipes]|nr:hypothetical protein TNCV_2558231 [Trichonephila clavipes]
MSRNVRQDGIVYLVAIFFSPLKKRIRKGELEVSWIGAGWSAWEEEDSLRSPDAHDANPRDRLPFVQ